MFGNAWEMAGVLADEMQRDNPELYLADDPKGGRYGHWQWPGSPGSGFGAGAGVVVVVRNQTVVTAKYTQEGPPRLIDLVDSRVLRVCAAFESLI